MADPALGEGAPAEPSAPAAAPGGRGRRFTDIVNPHPVAAFLFRRRTFIVLVGTLAMLPWAQPRPGMLLAGLCVALLAEAVRVWAAGTIHKTQELTTGGPYAYVRHPLYAGSFLHAVAYALMTGRWESFLLVVPLFWLVYGTAVAVEEAMLLKLYGAAYADYCRRVPRFVPRPGPRPSGHGRFCWRQVLANREHVTALWMVFLYALLALRLLRAP